MLNHKIVARFRYLLALAAAVISLGACQPSPVDRPNIVLIVFEDMGARIGAFGDAVAFTPVLDTFADRATLYPNTFTTAGVCAPSRSSLITGVHQQTLGTQHMRTRSPVPAIPAGGPIEYDAVPPEGVKAFPELLRRAGYYTTNDGKTDYQFGTPFSIWDANGPEADWRGRAAGQPFFAMFNILQTHESYIWPTDRVSDNRLLNFVTARNARELADKVERTDPSAVTVPPYLPDTATVRADIARHYDNISFAEQRVARILAKLEEDGLRDSTIIIITTDHGDGFPRMKRTVYDSGIKVPLMIDYPNADQTGAVNPQLISFVDLAPSILKWSGEAIPDWVQGRSIEGEQKRSYVFAAADRHDAVPGRSKAVRDDRYKLIRNYQPDLAVLRPLAFRDALPTMQQIWQLAAAGQLTEIQARLLAARPAEELYDTLADPHEVTNLASDPAHAQTLNRLRSALDTWIASTGDLSAVPEAEMIAEMWPGNEQPVTAEPTFSSQGGAVSIASATPGASIAYSTDGSDPASGALYTSPITPAPGETIKAIAVRYGYRRSPVAELTQ